jgi:bifunctional enzyme CysN/CysC
VSTLRYEINVNTLHRTPSPTLKLNEIGRCHIALNESVAFDRYRRNRATGAFIVIDRITNGTVGAGMILDRLTSENRGDHWDQDPQSQSLSGELSNVTGSERQARYGQTAVTLLITGLPGAGKSTTGYALERRLFDLGRSAMVIDGQNMRLGLCRDLGFSDEDRSENLRRAAEVAKIVNHAGLICILALVSPDESIRQRAAEVVGADRFIVVHLDASSEVCRSRHQSDKGGLSFEETAPRYQPPDNADLTLDTERLNPIACVDKIIEFLEAKHFI